MVAGEASSFPGDARHDHWLIHCDVLSKLLRGGILEEFFDVILEIARAVGFLDLVSEVMQSTDLCSVVLKCYWRIFCFGRFVVVFQVAAPQCAHFCPQYFYYTGQKYCWICGLAPRCLRLWGFGCALEFDDEVLVWIGVKFVLVGGGVVDVLVRYNPLGVKDFGEVLVIVLLPIFGTLLCKFAGPSLLMPCFDQKIPPLNGEESPDQQPPTDVLLGAE